jgi:hypothetical protein
MKLGTSAIILKATLTWWTREFLYRILMRYVVRSGISLKLMHLCSGFFFCGT